MLLLLRVKPDSERVRRLRRLILWQSNFSLAGDVERASEAHQKAVNSFEQAKEAP
jgi:hypothetical protein